MASPVFGYRPRSGSNSIPSGHPVEVIASFKTTGEFIPMYFRFTDDNSERFTFKINSIKVTKDKPGVKVFVCTYLVDRYVVDVMLCFDVMTMTWTVG